MFCDVFDVMNTQEQYVRGWLRLFGKVSPMEVEIEMGKYCVDLTKLKRAHMDQCPICLENEHGRMAEARSYN